MKVIKSIALRDIKSFLFTPMYYMLLAVCSLVWSFSFIKKTIDFSYASTSPKALGHSIYTFFEIVVNNHISTVNLMLIFAIPAMTMKLIAEEKKTRTIDLLLTSPVTSTQIILGKFTAGLVLSLLLVVLAFIYPLGSLLFTSIDLGLLLGSFLGVSLLASTYVAIGLFTSSLTDSSILSLVFAVSLNLFLWLLSQGTLYSDSTLLVTVLDHLSIGENLFSLVKGSISLSTIAYFLTLVIFFVFMSQKSIDSTRWR